ncbi:GNAT family N-acetyltransferase [Paenibacillus rigui]|uniref:GNAT family N-acetyltransferase n=1 Tax=Paenibacillus rigui TaxID=554312 RepID=A0A229UM82_9BACL|nr:GNAT family N-acetyltransferase [Paenibacillus rigui]OXM84493.1 GNAT family N-acetyltransferase [Paenibacillus rigui]
MKVRQLNWNETAPMDLLLSADPSQALVEQYLKRGQCYIGEYDSTLVAVYVLLPTRPDTVELVNIAVSEGHQGKGLGKQLVQHAIAEGRRQGYKTMEIGTGNSSVAQLALYQKCGFRMVGIDKDFFVRHYDEPIVENGIPCLDMVRLAQDL